MGRWEPGWACCSMFVEREPSSHKFTSLLHGCNPHPPSICFLPASTPYPTSLARWPLFGSVQGLDRHPEVARLGLKRGRLECRDGFPGSFHNMVV